MDKRLYEPTREDIDFVAGKRLPPERTIMLSEAEAEGELARNHIRLVAEAPAKAPRKAAGEG